MSLPARIRKLIEAEQQRSERAIGWAQLTLSLLMLVLYYLSPATNAAPSNLQPIPIVTSLYIMLTGARLFWTYKWGLPPVWVALSVIIDIGLLTALIWAFHLQYFQPPVFYVKSPAFVFYFVFIALRALRYESRYLVLSGLSAVAGWLALCFYASSSNPELVTDSYLTYFTSNTLLWGAQFDKVMSLLLVTGTLVFASYRGRKLLEASAQEGQAARDLSNFFSPEVADKIRRDAEKLRPGEGELREATILQMDLRGFTKLSARATPNEVMKIISEYQGHMVPIIQRNGGIIDKFMGDGIMAHFGTLGDSGNYAANALRAMEEVMRDIDAWNERREREGLDPIKVGLSACTGPVVVGAVGSEGRLEFTVIGEAVNVSAKLEKHTKTLGKRAICCDNTLQTALKQGFHEQTSKALLPRQTVEGVAEPMDLVVIRQ